jgi:hypothetical protein
VSSTNERKIQKGKIIEEVHKMGKNKKRPNEWVTMTCAHRRKDNMQFSPGGMMTKKQMQLLGIKRKKKKNFFLLSHEDLGKWPYVIWN